MMDRSNAMINEDELSMVNGGAQLTGAQNADNGSGTPEKTVKAYCNNCRKKTTFVVYGGTRAICKTCSKEQQV